MKDIIIFTSAIALIALLAYSGIQTQKQRMETMQLNNIETLVEIYHFAQTKEERAVIRNAIKHNLYPLKPEEITPEIYEIIRDKD